MHLEIWRFLGTEIEELEIQKYPGLEVGDLKICRLENWKLEFLESGKWKFENFQVWRSETSTLSGLKIMKNWTFPALEIGNLKISKFRNWKRENPEIWKLDIFPSQKSQNNRSLDHRRILLCYWQRGWGTWSISLFQIFHLNYLNFLSMIWQAQFFEFNYFNAVALSRTTSKSHRVNISTV